MEPVLFPLKHRKIRLYIAGAGRQGGQDATELHVVEKSAPDYI